MTLSKIDIEATPSRAKLSSRRIPRARWLLTGALVAGLVALVVAGNQPPGHERGLLASIVIIVLTAGLGAASGSEGTVVRVRADERSG